MDAHVRDGRSAGILHRVRDVASVRPEVDVLLRFLRLGLTSFGGPVAHIGYFRREFVERAGWLDDAAYAEIVALCSVLPGPTSTQVGITLGARRAGPLGALYAWIAFTLPSALAMGIAGTLAGGFAGRTFAGIEAGLDGVAAGVVLAAVVSMARGLVRTRYAAINAPLAALASLGVTIFAPAFAWAVIVLSGAVGAFLAPPTALPAGDALPRVPRAIAFAAAGLLAFGCIVVPLFASYGDTVALFATFFRAGSLVFGGGHVVLPFLETLVRAGHIEQSRFLFGYGLAAAMPGPLFTFAGYLGAADTRFAHAPFLGATVATLAIFSPSFLLLAAAAPVWRRLRASRRAARALTGLNAAVVGLLAAVFVDPIALSIASSPFAMGIAIAAFALLQFGRAPSWIVVAGGAAVGAVVARATGT